MVLEPKRIQRTIRFPCNYLGNLTIFFDENPPDVPNFSDTRLFAKEVYYTSLALKDKNYDTPFVQRRNFMRDTFHH